MRAEAQESQGMLPPRRAARIPALLVLCLVGCLLYLPSLGRPVLDNEEGRRAIPAREMLTSGDFVVPTIWGEPYLNKPPLYFWAVAAASALTDGVNQWSVRLPAVLATLATLVLLFETGRRTLGSRSGLFAALLFALSPLAFEKGALGELEAVLALCVLASSTFLFEGRAGGKTALVLSGIALGAGILTKGPPAVIFFGASALALVARRGVGLRLRRKTLWIGLLPLTIGLLLGGAWVLLLLQRVDANVVTANWTREVLREDGFEIARYLRDRGRYLGGLLGGFLPASIIVLMAYRTGAIRRSLCEPAFRFWMLSFGLSALVFLVASGTRSRYMYPALPWCCLAAGQLLAEVRAGERFTGRVRGLAFAIGALGLVATVVAALLPRVPIDGVGALSGRGYVLVALLCGAGLVTLGAVRREDLRRASWGALLVLAFLRLIQLTEIVPQASELKRQHTVALEIERVVPPGHELRAVTEGGYNELFSVDRPIRHLARFAEARPSEFIVTDRHLDESSMAADRPFAVLVSVQARPHLVLSVVRLDDRSEND